MGCFVQITVPTTDPPPLHDKIKEHYLRQKYAEQLRHLEVVLRFFK